MYAIKPNIISAAKYNTTQLSQWIKRFTVQGYKDLQNRITEQNFLKKIQN